MTKSLLKQLEKHLDAGNDVWNFKALNEADVPAPKPQTGSPSQPPPPPNQQESPQNSSQDSSQDSSQPQGDTKSQLKTLRQSMIDDPTKPDFFKPQFVKICLNHIVSAINAATGSKLGEVADSKTLSDQCSDAHLDIRKTKRAIIDAIEEIKRFIEELRDLPDDDDSESSKPTETPSVTDAGEGINPTGNDGSGGSDPGDMRRDDGAEITG